MRLKLGLFILLVAVIFGALVDFIVIGSLQNAAMDQLKQELSDGYDSYTFSRKANFLERLEHADRYAADKRVVDLMLRNIEDEEMAEKQHFDLYEKLELLQGLESAMAAKSLEASKLKEYKGKGELKTKKARNLQYIIQARYHSYLVIVVDVKGREVARTKTGKWFKNSYMDSPVISAALKTGTPGEDIWLFRKDQRVSGGLANENDNDMNGGKVLNVTVTPIKGMGEILGALLLCKEMNEPFAAMEGSLTPGDFAMFSRKRALGTTMHSTIQSKFDDWVKSNQGYVATILTAGKPEFKKLVLDDQTFYGLLAPMKGYGDKVVSGFALMENYDAFNSPFVTARLILFIFVVLLFGAMLAVAMRYFMLIYNAVDFALEGAHQIIMGNHDYQWSSEDDYSRSLGQTFNLMSAALQGKYIPEDEDDIERQIKSGGRSPTAVMKAKGTVGAPDILVETIADDTPVANADQRESSEDEYYNRLFKEFVTAKAKQGESVTNINLDQFKLKLKKAEAKLIEKHGCSSVIFSIVVENGQVTIKPSPVKD